MIFSDKLMMNALGWTLSLAVATTLLAVPMAVLAAKFYKATRYKVATVFLLLSPLFVAADIMGAALLVYFKHLNNGFTAVSDMLGNRVVLRLVRTWVSDGADRSHHLHAALFVHRGSDHDGAVPFAADRGGAGVRCERMAGVLGH